MPECYIRGNNVKTMRVEDSVLIKAEEDEKARRNKTYKQIGTARGFRGRGRGRGRGRKY